MKRQRKVCIGCAENFLTFKNYDYCKYCEINGSRYVNQKSPCSECDGSGIIKFKHQKPRPCKLCHLTKTTMKKNLSAEESEPNYWKQVNQLAQQKIYHLFTTNIPFQNLPLINEPWKYEERQQKLSGLFLRRDVDYRTLLVETENQWEEGEKLPPAEIIAEEIALWYCRMVMKALIADLSEYASYDPALFADLTASED